MKKAGFPSRLTSDQALRGAIDLAPSPAVSYLESGETNFLTPLTPLSREKR
jgi:hypothetical protein